MKLTENQEMYLNLFNEFVQQEVAPRIKELDEVDEYPIWMRDRMAELGFTRLVAPEEYGGFGESMTTLLMLIIEASKYNNNLASILNCSNNANKLLSFANQEQIDRFLPMIVDEGKFMGMAYTEPSGGSDSRAISTTAVLDGDGAGITIGGNFTENVGANLFWLRAENDNTNGYGKWHDDQNNAMDFVGLTLPLTFDGVKITPWGMYGFVGSRSLGGDAKGDIDDMRAGMLPVLPSGSDLTTLEGNRSEGNAWWVGITGEMTTFSPFRLAGDFNYGSVDMGTVRSLSGYDGATSKTIDLKRSGWLASAIAEYKLDFGVPGLLLWYGSGDNSNPYDGSERMPTVDAGWSGSSFGFDGGYGISSDTILGTSPVGTWGVALRMKDISFMENLTHAIQVGYYRGTNNKNMPANAGMTTFHASYPDATGSMVGSTYLTTKDGAWEATFDTDYQIYKDLTLAVELGYIHLSLNDGVWGNVLDNTNRNAYKASVNMRYAF